MLKLKPFRQSPGFCGPASLKMVLDYYGVSSSEADLAKISGTTKEKGTSMEGLAKAAEHFGFKTFVKKDSSIEDVDSYVKQGIPVIVDWFYIDDGHYSVVVDINKKELTLMDPTLQKLILYIRRRKIPVDKFLRIWFDFPGNFIKDSKDLILRSMLVIIPKKKY